LQFTAEQLAQLPSPFYRVATRAVILDEQQRILVAQNHYGEYELPGGGWDYDEPFDVCLAREITEELGVEMADCGHEILCVYRGRNDYGMTLRIAVRATLKSYDFKPADMASVQFVTKEEFLKLDFKPTADDGLQAYADVIWSGQQDLVY
jgi:8-oxo-dGTP pyrophosphatase MutT (NUDIX family)